MKKETKMILQKKEMVKKRSELVDTVCKNLIDNNIEITYRAISEETSIPSSTLQRSPYRDIIATYRSFNKNEQEFDREILLCREQIKHLRDVIKQLNKENHELKTKLFLEGKI